MKVSFKVHGRLVEFALDVRENDVASMKTYTVAAMTNGTCEPEIVQVFARVVQPGDFVIDGGANVGFFTCVLSRLVGPTGKVLAVEPGANNISALRANIKLNQLTNVEVVTQPLWSVADKVTLYLAHDGGLNSLSPHEHGLSRAEMVATTIDDLCNGSIPRLVKLDIEGAESHALRGGISTLDQCETVLLCEMNEDMLGRFGSSQMQLRRQAARMGLDSFVIQQDGSLPRLVPEQTRLLMSVQNRNIMFATLDAVGQGWPEQDLG